MQDIQLAQNGTLVENGDFRLGDSSVQQKFILITTFKGTLKNAPLLGVGIREYLLAEGDVLAKKHEIRRQLITDGAMVKKIEFTGNQVIVDAEY